MKPLRGIGMCGRYGCIEPIPTGQEWCGQHQRARRGCSPCQHARVFSAGDGTARRKHERVRCGRGHFQDKSILTLSTTAWSYCDGCDFQEAEP